MTPELPNPSLIPFLVAVTGHRDLRPQDLDLLRQEVRTIFSGMRRRMPNTPLILLTGLAEGADQLVAEVALEQDVLLAAAIPMPVDIYKEQMTEGARKKLDGLLALSSLQIMIPLEGRTSQELRTNEAARAECYEALARFLSHYGQSLIALWDGKNSQKRGGTSSVVHYVRSGALDQSAEDAELRCGIVYHVVTPRMSGSTPVPAIKTVELGCEPSQLAGVNRRDSSLQESAQNLRFAHVEMDFERFNRDAARSANQGSEHRSRLIGDETVTLSPFQKRLESLYEQADRISLGANGRRQFFLGAILVTALVGTLFYGIHGEMFGTHVWLWFSFPFFVIAALLMHRMARAKHVEETYLDTRALAEALRVQFFWTMAGINEPVDKYYLMDRRTELDWIRIALKNVWLLHQDTLHAATTKLCLTVVLDNWVKDQATWYRVKADRQSRSVHRREKVSQDGLLLAVAWSILVPFSILVHGPWHAIAPWRSLGPDQQFGSDWVYQALHVALAVPALLAGAYRLWVEQAGYEEQSRDYRSMEREFSIKARELEKHLEDVELSQGLLLNLGIEALNENGRWLLLHRERPLEVLSSP
jgi:hypothetical protein